VTGLLFAAALAAVTAAALDEENARLAVQRGAYDHIVKDHVDAHSLSHTLRYIIGGMAARDALQNSEARFRAMSDSCQLGIFVSDAGAIASIRTRLIKRSRG